jgi:tRNA(Ile)-lysidine synthase TilS/MesJ
MKTFETPVYVLVAEDSVLPWFPIVDKNSGLVCSTRSLEIAEELVKLLNAYPAMIESLKRTLKHTEKERELLRKTCELITEVKTRLADKNSKIAELERIAKSHG